MVLITTEGAQLLPIEHVEIIFDVEPRYALLLRHQASAGGHNHGGFPQLSHRARDSTRLEHGFLEHLGLQPNSFTMVRRIWNQADCVLIRFCRDRAITLYFEQ